VEVIVVWEGKGALSAPFPSQTTIMGWAGGAKTAILRQLELNGHAVVEEAATDVIALENAHGQR